MTLDEVKESIIPAHGEITEDMLDKCMKVYALSVAREAVEELQISRGILNRIEAKLKEES